MTSPLPNTGPSSTSSASSISPISDFTFDAATNTAVKKITVDSKDYYITLTGVVDQNAAEARFTEETTKVIRLAIAHGVGVQGSKTQSISLTGDQLKVVKEHKIKTYTIVKDGIEKYRDERVEHLQLKEFHYKIMKYMWEELNKINFEDDNDDDQDQLKEDKEYLNLIFKMDSGLELDDTDKKLLKEIYDVYAKEIFNKLFEPEIDDSQKNILAEIEKKIYLNDADYISKHFKKDEFHEKNEKWEVKNKSYDSIEGAVATTEELKLESVYNPQLTQKFIWSPIFGKILICDPSKKELLESKKMPSVDEANKLGEQEKNVGDLSDWDDEWDDWQPEHPKKD